MAFAGTGNRNPNKIPGLRFLQSSDTMNV